MHVFDDSLNNYGFNSQVDKKVDFLFLAVILNLLYCFPKRNM